MNPSKTEAFFNCYFQRDGVKEALWAWLCSNGYAGEDVNRWKQGILRYCAEGNLYAVLEEYGFVCGDSSDLAKKLEKVLSEDTSINAYHPSSVYIQTQETYNSQQNGKKRTCSFGERLTNNIEDNGSGSVTKTVKRKNEETGKDEQENEEVRLAVAEAFSSPFWPMVLFAGRSAQEGMDLHQYCLRLMHLTLLSLVLTSMQEETFGKDTVLRRLLPQIPDTYEYVFFDCPPSPQNQMNINVLTAVQYVLIPFGMEHGVDNSRIPETVQAARESVNPGLQLLGLFLTAVETGSSRNRERIASFPTMVSEQVFKSFIRKSEDVRNAASALLPPCFYAPHCTAAGDYTALCNEMLERMDN